MRFAHKLLIGSLLFLASGCQQPGSEGIAATPEVNDSSLPSLTAISHLEDSPDAAHTPDQSSPSTPTKDIAITQTAIPTETASPITPQVTPGANWATYHNTYYGFSFRYPSESWTLIEHPQGDNHSLSLAYKEMAIALRIKFKQLGEGTDLQLYGGAAGDFVPQGTVPFLGEAVERTARIYNDVVQAVHYNYTAAIPRDDLLFSLALVSNRDPDQGAIIPDNVQAEADAILTTFMLDAGTSFIATPESLSLGSAAVLFYQDGRLARADVPAGNIVSSIPVTGVGEDPKAHFDTNPPQVSPDGRWLVEYSAMDEATSRWQLFEATTGSLIATGSGQSRLSPTWSPNNVAFAFLGQNGLCVYSLESASEACSQIPTYDGTVLDPGVVEGLIGAAWSPDGRHIVLVQTDTSDPCCTVWLSALDGSKAFDIGTYTLPTHADTAEMIEWTADGRLLIKTIEPDMGSRLYSLTEDQQTITYTEPVKDVSADGRWILYRSGKVGDIDGSMIYELPTNEVCLQAALDNRNWAWSPDGEWLAFLLNCTASAEESRLYVLNAATGDVHWGKVLSKPVGAFSPLNRLFWSPDGAYLLLDTAPDSTQPLSPIWQLVADGSDELDVLAENGYLVNVVPQWAGK
ncbi:MAG: hypothetical protein R3C44_08270 [Chloroflexota bacterium]